MYYSSTEDKLVTLDEYVSRMKEEQKYIYYACGETVDKIKLLPPWRRCATRAMKFCVWMDNIDEFCIKMLAKLQGKKNSSLLPTRILGWTARTIRKKSKSSRRKRAHSLTALGEALSGKVKKGGADAPPEEPSVLSARRRPGNA